MFPVLVEIGPVGIQSYAAFTALGYLSALLLTRRLAGQQGLSPAVFTNLAFLLLLSGLVGARALFLLTNPASAMLGWAPWSGGLVFLGGFLLSLPVALLFLRWKKIPWKTGFDVLAPGLALGHAIGRLGCLAAGCCHGSLCELPWAVQLHSALVAEELRGLPLHPVQAYESGALAVLAVALLFLRSKHPPAGSLAAGYLAGYGAIRLVTELFRGDAVRGHFPGTALPVSQVIAAVLLATGLFCILRIIRGRGNH
jgi:phosphatidylglycerol---prolipoprotein diacylglyceryl transferase